MVAAFYLQTNIFRNKPISDGKNSKKQLAAVIVLLLCSFSIRAQHRYQTREGMMEVIGSYRDSISNCHQRSFVCFNQLSNCRNRIID
jgi:hypothetical protein